MPFYAGRENLIRRILRSAANAGELHRESGKSAGRTWVVQGAPGAGKSCLLEEMGAAGMSYRMSRAGRPPRLKNSCRQRPRRIVYSGYGGRPFGQ